MRAHRLPPLPAPPVDTPIAKPRGRAGNLEVLDWAGFKAAVSYTFDDANSSQLAHYDELQALGARYTFYLITSKAELDDPTWARAISDGHELGNHTRSHRRAASGAHDDRELSADIDAASQLLAQKFGVRTWTMAAPYGDVAYARFAEPRFLLNRGVGSGLIGVNDATDPFNTPCFIPSEKAPAEAFHAQLQEARKCGKWNVVLVHGFVGGTDGAYQPVEFEQFAAAVAHAKSAGDVWIDTMVAIGAYWRGQKAFSNAKLTTHGATTTHAWSLPPNFPPGRVLRVRVDGGTLCQGGVPLVWDPRGYYEVSLDVGSLTLGP